MTQATSSVAVVGAGWAGCAAAVQATLDGHRVTLFEASREPGGRARSVVGHGDGAPVLDNGQHILIGAYQDTLSLLRLVGVDTHAAFHRQPLALVFPDGGGLRLPDWPVPLDVLAGILRARGWTWGDRLSLLRCALNWQRSGYRCASHTTVDELCSGMTQRVRDELIDPLCVSALNTPATQADGTVFLRVLHDSLFGPRGSSHLLLPRVELGRLLPQPALRWLEAQGACVRLGQRVSRLEQLPSGWQVQDEPFDQVVLATAPWDAARLLEQVGVQCADWQTRVAALRYEAITTVYMQGTRGLSEPMLALHSSAQAPAQFVFDRGCLGGPQGMLAFVVSASRGERAQLESQVRAQAQQALGLQNLVLIQTIVEKRATLACTPGLLRPPMLIAPGLLACGDYIEGPYPSTLEGAVRSGLAAARALGSSVRAGQRASRAQS